MEVLKLLDKMEQEQQKNSKVAEFLEQRALAKDAAAKAKEAMVLSKQKQKEADAEAKRALQESRDQQEEELKIAEQKAMEEEMKVMGNKSSVKDLEKGFAAELGEYEK